MKTYYEIPDWELSYGVYVKTRKHRISITLDIKWVLQRIDNLRANGVIPKVDTSNLGIGNRW